MVSVCDDGAGAPEERSNIEAAMNVVPPLRRIVLAQEGEFHLGALRVFPSRREVVADGQREFLQPRIMQVLVVLARRRGEVVSRDELIMTCWGGQVVSDDAINRCIARIRRLSETLGGFNLETVPRIGYQLSEYVAKVESEAARPRRLPIAGVFAAAAVALVLLIAVAFVAVILLRQPEQRHSAPLDHASAETSAQALLRAPAA